MSKEAYALAGNGGGLLRFWDPHHRQQLVLDREELVEFIAPSAISPIPASAAIQEALEAPVGSERLPNRVAGASTVAIITSDSTRSVPTALLLDGVMEELRIAGIDASQVTVIVGTGMHRGATQEEMQALLGVAWTGRVAIENHRAGDDARLVAVGRTKLGNEVLVNQTVAEADVRIALGQVEPHEFAGFTGGPKSILAGVSGEPTIRRNHSPELLLHPAARPGILEGNPIWEDMLEAAELTPLDFIVNVVLTPDREIAAVIAGDVRAAHREAVRVYGKLYGTYRPPAKPADIVVTTPGPPLNRSLYQSIKAIIAAEGSVREGGAVVLTAECDEGTGGEAFVAPYREARSPEEVIAVLRRGYQIEMDHALLLCRLLSERRLGFFGYLPGVSAETLRLMFFTPAESLQAAYEVARKWIRSESRLGLSPVRTAIFPQPQQIVTLPGEPYAVPGS